MDIDEFTEFVNARYAELLRTAYLLTGSPWAAEDLLQTCLVRVMSRWRRVDDPMAYLRRAMVNDRTSRWRRLSRELLRADPPEVAVADPTATVGDRTVLVAELARLPRRMRAAIVLRYWEDLSEAETAEVLGCSVGSVKSQTSRGLARLRAVLNLVVVRLPDDRDPTVLSDRLLILGPPGATSATVTGSVTATVPLTGGAGVVTAKAPATIDVRAGGATARLAEPDGAAQLAFGLPCDTY